MRPLPRALLALCFAGALMAQARRTCVGVVLGVDGKPMTSGTVCCVYASPGDPSFAGDRQTATIDGRGRFRIPLWPGVTYATWFIGPDEPDGSRAVSAITRAATGGGYFELRVHARARPHSISIGGLAAWREHGAATIRLHLTGSDQAGIELPIDRDGATITTPTLPAGPIPFVVLDGDRSPLVCGMLPADRLAPVQLAGPQVRVVHVDGQGADVASVGVLLRIPEPWDSSDLPQPAPRYLRRTAVPVAANGTVKVVLPAQLADRQSLWRRSLFVEASTATAGPTAVMLAASSLDQLRHVRGIRPISIQLAECQTIRLPDRAGEQVLVVPDCGPFRTGSATAMPRALVVPDNATIQLQPTCSVLRVYGTDRNGGRPAQLLAEVRTLANGQHKLLRADKRLRIRAVDETGGPASNAFVAVVRRDDRFPAGGVCSWHRTDSGGSVTLRLATGEYGAHATDGHGIASRLIELRGAEDLSLRLHEMQAMRCRFTDGNGRALAGVRVDTVGHGNRPTDADWFELQSFDVAQQVTVRQAFGLRSDRDGRLVVRFTAPVGAGAMLIFKRPDGTRTNTVAVQEVADWLQLR